MAAINFPDSPSNGDTHVVGDVTYTYNAAETKWKTTINSNAFLPLTGGTVSGTLTVNDDLAVDTDTLFVDVSNDRVGIGTSSPDRPFHLKGSGTQQLKVESTDNSVELELVGGGSVNYVSSDDSLSFYVNGSTRATIESTNGDFQFNSGYGSVATAYGVRAWARINGAGTISTYDKGGFGSITDQGSGVYRFNFSSAMPDTNYAVAGSTDGNTIFQVSGTFNTGYFDTNIQTTNATATDSDHVSVIVVR